MKRVLVIIFFLSFSLKYTIALSRGESPNKIVLAEYADALRRLQLRFAEASGTVSAVKRDVSRKESAVKRSLYKFASMRPRMAKVMIERDVPTESDSSAKVLCYNESYSFLLQRDAANKDFYIRSLDTDKGMERLKRSTQAYLDNYLDAPLSMEWFPILMMIEDPKFSLQSVLPVTENGNDMMRLVFEWALPSDKSAGGGYEGSLIVSPKKKWVLHSYEYRPKNGLAVHKGKIEYGEAQDGYPVPKRFETSVFDVRDNILREVDTYEFRDFRFSTVPAEDFTLAAFGFPDRVLNPRDVTRTGRSAYWLFGLGFGSLAVCIAIKSASSFGRKGPKRAFHQD